jgi:hypothetical protein
MDVLSSADNDPSEPSRTGAFESGSQPTEPVHHVRGVTSPLPAAALRYYSVR